MTRIVPHRPVCCSLCGQAFAEDTVYQISNARYELELEVGSSEEPALRIEHIQHQYFRANCVCGHESHAAPDVSTLFRTHG